MKKPSCLRFLLVAYGLCAFAQSNTLLAADTSPAAITTNQFPRSDAVILSDETKVDVAVDGSFNALRHVRAKILTSRGRKSSEVIVPFHERLQQIDFHFAKATQPDGSVQSVKPEEIQTEVAYRGYLAYSDVKVSFYRIRGADVGSILDQEYVLKAKPVMGDQFWMVWRPRNAPPVLSSQLVLRVPANRKIQWRIHNVDQQPQVVESDDKQWKTYTWKYSGSDELETETYMPAPDEFLPWLEVSTVESWNDVAKWLDQISQPQVDSSPQIQNRVRNLTAQLIAPPDKIAAIFYWVEDNIHFVNVDVGLSGYKPRLASQTFESRYGDGKDMCTLLAAMLRDAGIQARLAFLESGSARKISDRLPMARTLTHCIVLAEAGGKTYYLDPTAETARYDTVLGRLCNTDLLLLGSDANRLIPSAAYDGGSHGTRQKIKIQLSADGSAKGQVITEYLGESDSFIRAAMKYVNPEKLRNLMEQELKKNLPNAKLTDYEVADVSMRTRNFTTSYSFETKGWAALENGTLKFKPQLPQHLDVSEEIFGKGERHQAFVFFETAPAAADVEITLPDGFKIESLPKDIDMENSFSSWKRTIKQDGQKLLVTEASHLKTARLPKETIVEIRKYYDDAITHKSECVVLKTK